jgi:hypothetical protein
MQQMERITLRSLRCRYNTMWRSQPALGKTYRINAIAAALKAQDPDFVFEHFDCGTMAPTDLRMAMPDMSEKQIVSLVDERLPNAYKTPDAVGMIYWGEWMLAGLEVNRGLQKLINHEDLGGYRMPDGVINIADGNRAKDKSGAQVQSIALMSRFLVIDLEYDSEYALAVMKGYHERIAAFGIRHPVEIDNYSDVFENSQRTANDLTLQEGKAGIWANLRSWDRLSRMMRDADENDEVLEPEEISRTIGSGKAATFTTFCKMLDQLATIEDVIAHPDTAPVPTRMDEQYALSTMLALLVNKANFEGVAAYMQRYKHEIQTVYFRTMNDRLMKAKDGNASAIRSSLVYKKWITMPHINALLRGAAAQ